MVKRAFEWVSVNISSNAYILQRRCFEEFKVPGRLVRGHVRGRVHGGYEAWKRHQIVQFPKMPFCHD